AEQPPTTNAHIGFVATSRRVVDRWWETLTMAGYRDDGAPGPRPQYSPSYYGAFIRDHDNNSIEAVHHEHSDRPGGIDHVWIRVRDLDATRRLHSAIAPAVGLQLQERPGRLHLSGESGGFTLLEGRPTQNLHLAIGVADKQTVGAFHAVGLEAGAADNG